MQISAVKHEQSDHNWTSNCLRYFILTVSQEEKHRSFVSLWSQRSSNKHIYNFAGILYLPETSLRRPWFKGNTIHMIWRWISDPRCSCRTLTLRYCRISPIAWKQAITTIIDDIFSMAFQFNILTFQIEKKPVFELWEISYLVHFSFYQIHVRFKFVWKGMI